MSQPLVANGLIYLSHESFDVVRLPPSSDSTADSTKGGAGDPANIVQTNYDFSVTRNYLDVIDFSDSKDPVVRKPVNIPGSLIGTSPDGALLYTTGTHWTTNNPDVWMEWLDASAYDGVAAYLVDSVLLPAQWPHPVVVFGTNVCVGLPAGTNAPNQLQVLNLDSNGKFAVRQTMKLQDPVQQMDIAGRFLLLQTASDLKMYALSPDGIIPAGEGTEASCYYYFQQNKTAANEAGIWFPMGDYGVLSVNAGPAQ
jgi:hypothetical protein